MIHELRSPSLIGGVSQQGPTRRLGGQVEEQDNVWASPVDGARKRHPSDHIASLVPAPGLRDARLHPIKRDGEEYLVLLEPGAVRVFGTDGTVYPVHGPDAPYDPDFAYIETRSGAQHLESPEDFSAPWILLEDATAPAQTGIPGPYGFGEATTLGNANQTIGFDGIYQQIVGATSPTMRKHFSVHVRLHAGAPAIAGIRLVMHEGGSSSANFEAAWQFIDGIPTLSGSPSVGVQARTVTMDDGWFRLETTYQPDGVNQEPLDYVRLELLATGVLGPDHLLDCFGAQLADSDLLTFDNYPNYIRGRVDEDLRATTVQDTTWLVNGSITVRKDTAISSGQVIPENTAVFWIRQGGANALYSVVVNTTLGPEIVEAVFTGTYVPGPTPPWPPGTVTEIDTIGTQDTAAALAGLLAAHASIDAEAIGSLLIINPTVPGDTFQDIRGWDDFGEAGMQLVRNEVASIDQLPTTYYNGQRVKVIGTTAGTEDDYWVQFRADSIIDPATQIGPGAWYESVAPEIETEINPATMPHVLLRKFDDGDGTITGTPGSIYFEFGPATWGARLVGDDDSNQFPSFVSTDELARTIVDAFYHKNRLGFLSGPNIVLSETGRYFNFFRTTVTSLPDSELIDVEAAHRKVNKLFAAAPFQGQLLAFSENSVFALRGNPVLAPRTVEFPSVHESEILVTAAPATSAGSVLWCVPSRGFTRLREGFVPSEAGEGFQLAHNDISEQAPAYVRGRVLDLVVSGVESEMVAAMRADGDLSVLYIFKSHVTGARRVQSAWWRYPFGDAHISGLAWIEDRLYLAIERDRELELECIRMVSAATDEDSAFQVCLDRRVTNEQATPTYNLLEQETTFAMPYTVLDHSRMRVVTRAVPGTEGGEPLAIARTTASVIVVQGDLTETAVWIGEEFDAHLNPGRVVVRGQTQDGLSAPRLNGSEVVLGGLVALRGPIQIDVRLTDRQGEETLEPLRDDLGPEAPFGEVVHFPRYRDFSAFTDPDQTTLRIEWPAHFATHLDALEWLVNKRG